MKRKIFNFLLVLSMFAAVTVATAFFASCSQASGGGSDSPGTNTETVAIQTRDGVRYVKNSDWDGCTLAFLSAKAASGGRMMARSMIPESTERAAADISAEDLVNIVETLNENSTDTQYFVSTEDVPVEEGPLCTVYFINECDPDDEIGESDDWKELRRVENVEREDVKNNRMLWEIDATNLGAILYVDKVPPKPVIVKPIYTEESCMMTIINKSDGSIRFQKNVFLDGTPEELAAYGFTTFKQYYDMYLAAFQLDTTCIGSNYVYLQVGGYYPARDPEPEE